MRDHPQRIRAVVMDGVTGPTFNVFDGYNAYIWQSLRQVFTDCAASSFCGAAYPHLEQTFTRLLARLQAHPARVESFLPRLNREVSTTMNGVELWATMRDILGDPTGPPLVPQIITQFAAGDYHIAVQFAGITLSEGSNATTTVGMHYSMECSGEPAGSSPATIAAHSQMVPASIRTAAISYIGADLHNCAVWRVPSIPSVNHTYFRSAIPTLLLPGRYDPATPPPLAQALAPRLGHAYLVVIPTLGHVVVGHDWCPDQIASDFLDHPSRKPDTSCVADMPMHWK